MSKHACLTDPAINKAALHRFLKRIDRDYFFFLPNSPPDFFLPLGGASEIEITGAALAFFAGAAPESVKITGADALT